MASPGEVITVLSRRTRQPIKVRCESVHPKDGLVMWQSLCTQYTGSTPIEQWDACRIAQAALEDKDRKKDGLESYLTKLREENESLKNALRKCGHLTATADRLRAIQNNFQTVTIGMAASDLLEIRLIASETLGEEFKGLPE